MAALEGLDLRPLPAEDRLPTLVVGGEADATFPPEHSRALADGIPGARLVLIREGSHGLVPNGHRRSSISRTLRARRRTDVGSHRI
jgi:3-oxoadipate enol-lactonase